jgi:hypothetical protein
LEKRFGDFEGKASQALKRIMAARSIQDPTDRAILFELMALFATKNPHRRETFRLFMEEVLKRVLQVVSR